MGPILENIKFPNYPDGQQHRIRSNRNGIGTQGASP
jgi:hypothetical protein